MAYKPGSGASGPSQAGATAAFALESCGSRHHPPCRGRHPTETAPRQQPPIPAHLALLRLRPLAYGGRRLLCLGCLHDLAAQGVHTPLQRPRQLHRVAARAGQTARGGERWELEGEGHVLGLMAGSGMPRPFPSSRLETQQQR